MTSAKSLAKSLAESLTKTLSETIGVTFGETLGETFHVRQASPQSLGSDYMHSSLQDSLRDSFFLRGSFFKSVLQLYLTSQTPLNSQIFENIKDFIFSFWAERSTSLISNTPRRYSWLVRRLPIHKRKPNSLISMLCFFFFFFILVAVSVYCVWGLLTQVKSWNSILWQALSPLPFHFSQIASLSCFFSHLFSSPLRIDCFPNENSRENKKK